MTFTQKKQGLHLNIDKNTLLPTKFWGAYTTPVFPVPAHPLYAVCMSRASAQAVYASNVTVF
jgi:hypothetical protein